LPTDPKTEAAVAAMLAPGEVLRVYGGVNVAHGDTGPITDTDLWADPAAPHNKGARALDRLTRTPARKLLFYTVLSPVLLLVALESVGDRLTDRVDRLVGGVTCAGPPGSLARRIEHALSALGGRADHVAVTDRRLLLLKSRILTLQTRFDHVWEVPLHAIAGARPLPRGLLRRRVQLWFPDGSYLVLALPRFAAPRPSQMCAALAGVVR
jgi:hypothetical protein